MSWLRDHFHEFVYPAFAAAGKPSSELGSPYDVRPSPHAPEKLPTELKKLWTLCQEQGVQWTYDVREGTSGGNSKFRESAKIHSQILKNTLDAAVGAMKAEKCSRLLLGGRDVWTIAVLCEKRGIPYLFVPELSRHVARSPLSRPFLESRGFTGQELFLDTGFAGSIPKSLKAHFGNDFKFRLMSQSDVMSKYKVVDVTGEEEMALVDSEGGAKQWVKSSGVQGPGITKMVPKGKKVRASGQDMRPNQLFPNRKQARAEALETEYLAKYWGSGEIESKKALQGHAPSVFADWQKRPNVRRYSDPMNRQLGLTDGVDMIQVAMSDVKQLVPEFAKWWQTLPECPYDQLPKDEHVRVLQRFASREHIQRAALLTSQLWRGIPYWKHVQPSPGVQPQKPQIWVADASVNQIGTTNYIVTNSAATSLTFNTSVTSGTAGVIYQGDLNSGLLQPMQALVGQPMSQATMMQAQQIVQKQQHQAAMNGMMQKLEKAEDWGLETDLLGDSDSGFFVPEPGGPVPVQDDECCENPWP